MSLTRLRVDGFRCLSAVRLDAHPTLNLIVGGNGAGKTSLLEAIYVLGRGRSFRGAKLADLVRTGQAEATVFGDVVEPAGKLGVRVAAGGCEIRVDGLGSGAIADLAARLPVQLIDPAVHALVQGGPGERRRFLDWGVFHVKHEFLEGWRRFRRALQQRNAALKRHDGLATVTAWEPDFLAGAAVVDQCRQQYVLEISPIVQRYVAKFFEKPFKLRYRTGWSDTGSLAEALAAGADRDRALGATQAGPHRAELELLVDDQPARHRLSRGQQKLLGAAMVLAQAEWVRETTGKCPVLLVDEPAAELDAQHLGTLVESIVNSGSQIFITALTEGALPLQAGGAKFHVERGELGVLV
jgi:DNA replication and repair protein RecF